MTPQKQNKEQEIINLVENHIKHNNLGAELEKCNPQCDTIRFIVDFSLETGCTTIIFDRKVNKFTKIESGIGTIEIDRPAFRSKSEIEKEVLENFLWFISLSKDGFVDLIEYLKECIENRQRKTISISDARNEYYPLIEIVAEPNELTGCYADVFIKYALSNKELVYYPYCNPKLPNLEFKQIDLIPILNLISFLINEGGFPVEVAGKSIVSLYCSISSFTKNLGDFLYAFKANRVKVIDSEKLFGSSPETVSFLSERVYDVFYLIRDFKICT